MKYFKVNDNLAYADDPHAAKNTFLKLPADTSELPRYDDVKDKLPKPIWQGHDDTLACYTRTWEIAWQNIKKANREAGFVSHYIDTAFNGYLFMWDSSFIVMFGKYASRYFDFQKTLDNFYSNQHKDGYICREIAEDIPGAQWARDDPSGTGPNILPWAEWQYFLSTSDKDRLSRVFDPLFGYHTWLSLNRTWRDGTYWYNGLSCGMDNSPRPDSRYHVNLSHGFMSWIDACAHQYISATILIKMAKILGREDETAPLKEEAAMLETVINTNMWDEESAFYYDRRRDGSLNGVKTAASYWTLIAGLVSPERAERFIAHLDNEKEFKRPVRVPSLSADHPAYRENGDYWRGSVWAPTNYMILSGLEAYGYHTLAHEIALNYVDAVTKVFLKDGTLYENYAPEYFGKGEPAKAEFVGWTGLAPISVLFEFVFGLKPDAMAKKITWHVNLTEEHGIKQYPLGDATVDLLCHARETSDQEPIISLSSDKPLTLEVIWNGKSRVYENVTKI